MSIQAGILTFGLGAQGQGVATSVCETTTDYRPFMGSSEDIPDLLSEELGPVTTGDEHIPEGYTDDLEPVILTDELRPVMIDPEDDD